MTTHRTTSSRAARRFASLGAFSGAALLLVACGSGSYSSPAAPAASATPGAAGTIGATSTGLGSVLTDGSGRTMYVLTADSPGMSSCSGACVAAWPVVAATTDHASSVTATTGAITRADGTKQLTVDGMPVYTYVADHAPGATDGQGVESFGGTWWVLGPDGKPITKAPSSMPAGRY